MVHRVVWVVPAALTLGFSLHGALAALQRRIAERTTAPATGRHAALWLGAAAACALALAPRASASWKAVKLRNRVGVSDGERDLMHAIGRDRTLAGRVLAPRAVAIRLPAWTSRLQPYPSLDELRVATPRAVRDWDAFYAADAIGEAEIATLQRQRIAYVIAPTGSAIAAALHSAPAAFKRVYEGPAYALYAWRPERWTAGPPVTSFDTPAGNRPSPPP
jgi:hypothetical protein